MKLQSKADRAKVPMFMWRGDHVFICWEKEKLILCFSLKLTELSSEMSSSNGKKKKKKKVVHEENVKKKKKDLDSLKSEGFPDQDLVKQS